MLSNIQSPISSNSKNKQTAVKDPNKPVHITTTEAINIQVDPSHNEEELAHSAELKDMEMVTIVLFSFLGFSSCII